MKTANEIKWKLKSDGLVDQIKKMDNAYKRRIREFIEALVKIEKRILVVHMQDSIGARRIEAYHAIGDIDKIVIETLKEKK
jgi:hypothetical protein